MADKTLVKIRLENDDGNKTFYPHTSTDIVFDGNGKNLDELLKEKSNKVHKHMKSEITDMPTKLSQFTNDSKYQTDDDVEELLNEKQNRVLYGNTNPSNDIGKDGDVYIMIEG